MASLNTRADGTRSVQFTDPAGKRRTVYLGKLPKRAAEEFAAKVGHLASLQRAGMPVDPEAAAWVSKLSDAFADKLAAVGLVPARRSSTLGAFLADYLAGRALDSKRSTVKNIGQPCADLLAFFGEAADVRRLTPVEADAFRRHLQARVLAPTTVARRLKTCQMLFKYAAVRGLVSANPFAGVKCPAAGPDAARQRYVGRDDVRKVIAACDPDWQTLIALSRFAGLRAPSEVFSLRWVNVDLAAGRMVVDSPKTEHHPGGESRVVPVFPDLRPYLEDAFDRAGDSGAVHVVNGVGESGRRQAQTGESGWSGVKLSSPFDKRVRRAGLEPWPKSLHNMRASCETDLMQEHPIHVVCAWIGNTPKVALGHYLQTLDSDFEKALSRPPTPAATQGAAKPSAPTLQKALPSAPVGGRHRPAREAETPGKEGPRGEVTAGDGEYGGGEGEQLTTPSRPREGRATGASGGRGRERSPAVGRRGDALRWADRQGREPRKGRLRTVLLSRSGSNRAMESS